MAYMKKFKTSPSATALDLHATLADKDANGKDIHTYVAGGTLVGTDLSLYDGQTYPVSTIDLSGIGGTIHTVEVRYTDTTITGQASDAATAMKAGTGTWSVTITPALPAGKTLFDVNRVFNGFCYFPNADSGYQNHLLFNTELNNNYPTFLVENDNGNHSIGAIVTVFVASDGSYVMDWGWTDLSSGGSGNANTNIAFIAQTSGWPTLSTIYYIPGTYKLTNQIGIKATGYGSGGPYEKSILATALLLGDVYASAEDYLASNPTAGSSLKIIAWFVVNVNTIAKVTANCIYDGNGGYSVSSASATSVTYVGE